MGYHKTFINIGIVFAVAFIILIKLILVGKAVIKNKQNQKIYDKSRCLFAFFALISIS
jgi:hypothetical protein